MPPAGRKARDVLAALHAGAEAFLVVEGGPWAEAVRQRRTSFPVAWLERAGRPLTGRTGRLGRILARMLDQGYLEAAGGTGPRLVLVSAEYSSNTA